MAQTILQVDLTSGRIGAETVPVSEVVKYLGGRGISAKLLYERLEPGIDPLGPDNVLIFAPGTLAGTRRVAARSAVHGAGLLANWQCMAISR